jgi:aminocarboxymuconate-semialdehyde decarboxylase
MWMWSDLDRRLEALDVEGIERQILIFHTSHVFYGAEPKIGIDTARRFNDGMAEMIATCRDPKRYLGVAHLPMQDPEAAAREAERAVKRLAMPGVVIGTNVRGKDLDAPEFWPFFSAIEELDVPIIVHSDGLTGFQSHPAAPERTGWRERAPFVAEYPLWWMLGHPIEHMIAIARIVYSGLLDRFPKLRFLFEEGNVGYALYLFDRLEEGWEFGEALFGKKVHARGPAKKPLEYLDHFYWAIEPEDSLAPEAIRRWGAERILFGTDFPHSDTPWPDSVRTMEKTLAGFPEEDRAKVFGGNALQLFAL